MPRSVTLYAISEVDADGIEQLQGPKFPHLTEASALDALKELKGWTSCALSPIVDSEDEEYAYFLAYPDEETLNSSLGTETTPRLLQWNEQQQDGESIEQLVERLRGS